MSCLQLSLIKVVRQIQVIILAGPEVKEVCRIQCSFFCIYNW